MTFVLRMITALVLMFSLTAALPAASVQADTVRVLPISGDIDGSQVAFIQRGLRQAEEKRRYGRRHSYQHLRRPRRQCVKIRDMIMASDVPVIAILRRGPGRQAPHRLVQPPHHHGPGKQYRCG